MPMLVTCPTCGHEYEASREEVLSGRWRGGCPVCRPRTRDDPPAPVCEGCGRPSRAGRRRVCGRCLGIPA